MPSAQKDDASSHQNDRQPRLRVNKMLLRKKHHLVFLAGLIFAIAPLWVSAHEEHATPQRTVILTSHNLYPYGSYPDGHPVQFLADQNFQGIAVDAVRCIFNKLEVPIEIQVVPWKRAQALVKSDKADGFFAASQKASRDAYAVRSAVIANQQWNWYLLKENPLNPEDPSFKEQAGVAGFLGANMLDWMDSNGYQVKARSIDTAGLLNLLLMERVDAVMANNYVMDALLFKYGIEEDIKSFTHKDKPLSVYFSKQFVQEYPAFMGQFDQVAPSCRKTKEHNHLSTP